MIRKPRRKIKTNVSTGMYEPYESELCISFYSKYLILKAYNQLNNVILMHIANEQMSNKGYTLKLLRMGMMPGAADYMVAIKGGRCAYIEFKRSSKSKQSPAQKKFQALMEELGIGYYLVFDVDVGIELLQKLNVS